MRRRCALVWLLLTIVACAADGTLAQDPASALEVDPLAAGFREAAILPVDRSVLRKVRTARDYFTQDDFRDGLAFLDRVVAEHRYDILSIGGGRYESVPRYARRLLGALPSEGRDVWREVYDAEAVRLWEDAQSTGSLAALQRIADEYFLSSIADRALLMLGDELLLRGEVVRAGWVWDRLDFGAGGWSVPVDRIRVPAMSVEPHEVAARRIIAALASEAFAEADRLLERFRSDFPDVNGDLLGESGPLVDILTTAVSERERWRLPKSASRAYNTFGGSNRRTERFPAPLDIGAPLWSFPLDPDPLPGIRPRASLRHDPPRIVPAANERFLFHCDGRSLLGHQITSGLPVFPAEPIANGDLDAYRVAPLLPDTWGLPLQPTAGIAFRTVTLSEGWAYAVVGSPVAGRAPRELRSESNRLLKASIDDPDALPDDAWPLRPEALFGSGWVFLGAPVADSDRLYAVIGRGQANVEREVVCLDARSGVVLWRREAYGAVSPVDAQYNLVETALLTLAEGILVYATHRGAVLAFEAETGRMLWATAYESEGIDDAEAWGDPRNIGLLPPVVSGGVVVVRPNDSPDLLGLDLQTGVRLWSLSVADRLRHLIGVSDGVLVVSGRSLWGVDLISGRLLWGGPRVQPAAFGYGRGLLVGSDVWFPTRDRIERRDARTGVPASPPIRLDQRGGSGGNLLIVGDVLIVAEPRRIVAYGPYAGRRE